MSVGRIGQKFLTTSNYTFNGEGRRNEKKVPVWSSARISTYFLRRKILRDEEKKREETRRVREKSEREESERHKMESDAEDWRLRKLVPTHEKPV